MQTSIPELLTKLTIDEKIQLLTGADFFASRPIPRLDIPALKLSDGPHGVRAQSEGAADHLGLNASAAATCFPSGAALASSWDPELTTAVGEAVGQEARYYGIHVMLGPAFNIKRSPLCGRNFEYYSEDPYLSGKLASAYIKAMQAQGVSTCPKHFVANNQEDRRMVSNSVMNQRTLHEIYLSAFETAVKESSPWSIMCSYNMLNGTFASENKVLLTDILRKEWGFDGAVVSDWGAVSHRAKAAVAGLDLEMPGTLGYSDTMLRDALEAGDISEDDLDRCVEALLLLIERTTDTPPLPHIDYEAHHMLAQKIAEQCMVLLKNANSLLPLAPSGHIAVLGALARHPRYQGGGSSHVSSWQVDEPLTCIRDIAPNAEFTYASGYDLADGNRIDQTLLNEAVALAAQADTVILFVGLTEQFETEGSDRESMALPPAHNALVEQIAAINPNAVVVLTTGAPVELPWLEQIPALLSTYTTGDGMGSALAGILFGKVNPSGKLAETMPLCLEHSPAYLTFRESKRDIHYNEGVFVGYRWYEKRKLPVLFPFGHGLSYTEFLYDSMSVNSDNWREGEMLTVSLTVTNTGDVSGKEVVQLYVKPEHSPLPRPIKELKGFAKVELDPGQSKAVTFELDKRSFSYYNEAIQGWEVSPGTVTLCIGASSADIRLTEQITVEAPAQKLSVITQETTFGELVDNPRTYPILCRLLQDSPMYRPAEMPDAPDFLRNLPLWTLNHMAGRAITPQDLTDEIQTLNQALCSKQN